MPISAKKQKRYKEGESIPGIRVSNNQNRQQSEQAAIRMRNEIEPMSLKRP